MDNAVKKIEEYMNSLISPKDRVDEYIKKYSLKERRKNFIFGDTKKIENKKRITRLYCTNCNEHFVVNDYSFECPRCKSLKEVKKLYVDEYKSKKHFTNIFFIVEVLDKNCFNVVRIDEIVDLSNFDAKETKKRVFVRGFIEYDFTSDEVFAYILKRNGGYRKTKKLMDLFNPQGKRYTNYHIIGIENLDRCTNFYLKTGYKEIISLTCNTDKCFQKKDIERLVEYINYQKNQNKNNMELLAKIGYCKIVENGFNYRAYEKSKILNREGTKLKDIIRLPKNVSQAVKHLGERDILLLEEIYKLGKNLTLEFVEYLLEWREKTPFLGQDVISGTRNMVGLGFSNSEIYSYLIKADLYQAIPPYETLSIWYDYINMAQKMNVPYKRFPNSLKKEHDLMVRNYQYQKDEIIEKEFQKRKEQLKTLEYEGENFVIVIPKKTSDIVREGKVLRHCVASYIEKVASGKTTIVFLREKNRIDEPFYTIEVMGEKIVQVKGFANKNANNEIMEFVSEWKKAKLEPR